MLWTSFRKVINIENALQYFTFRNLGYHFTSKKMHSINFRKCPLFLLTNYEVAWGLDVSSDCNVFLKSFSVINDASKYLVEGNLSRLFLLATNLSPPTSRMTHLPSHLPEEWCVSCVSISSSYPLCPSTSPVLGVRSVRLLAEGLDSFLHLEYFIFVFPSEAIQICNLKWHHSVTSEIIQHSSYNFYYCSIQIAYF